MPVKTAKPYQPHDHSLCVNDALSTARAICKERQVRFTTLREQVFTIILQSHKPLGAYAVLNELQQFYSEQQKQPAPPTVYRALEFLLENHLIHRIASLNAFISCCAPASPHQGYFLICRECETTLELEIDAIDEAIQANAKKHGFKVEQRCVEVSGLCPNCQ